MSKKIDWENKRTEWNKEHSTDFQDLRSWIAHIHKCLRPAQIVEELGVSFTIFNIKRRSLEIPKKNSAIDWEAKMAHYNKENHTKFTDVGVWLTDLLQGLSGEVVGDIIGVSQSAIFVMSSKFEIPLSRGLNWEWLRKAYNKTYRTNYKTVEDWLRTIHDERSMVKNAEIIGISVRPLTNKLTEIGTKKYRKGERRTIGN